MLSETLRILSIDGGGIRGLIPALILEELENRLGDAGKDRQLYKHFDLIAGTSTGGIIAAGLAAPKSPTNKTRAAMDSAGLAKLYREDGPKMFSRNVFRRFREGLVDPRSIIQEKYDADNLEKLLKKYLGKKTLVSQALTNVLITAYDIELRQTVVIKRRRPSSGTLRDDYLFWEAARATSAAPTYFEPARVTEQESDSIRTLIDGGVFANDPAMCAYVEGLGMKSVEDVMLVSLGTGYQTRAFEFEDAKNWGPINWINPSNGVPILSILMHGQANSTAYQLDQLLNTRDKKNYYRFDKRLTLGNDEMDDASETNLNALALVAREIVNENDEELSAIVDRL